MNDSGPIEAGAHAPDSAAAGLSRLPPPPRRLAAVQAIRLLEAGAPGRPLLRPLAMALLCGVFAGAMALPDLLCSLYPTYEMQVVSAQPRELPGPLAGLSDVLPAALRGHEVVYRLPSGEIQGGGVSAAEFLAISAGQEALRVHAAGSYSRPASGLFGGSRLALVGLFAAVSSLFVAMAVIHVRQRWWIVRLVRKGSEAIGRVTEIHSDRLIRADRPVGRVYSLYYTFPTSTQRSVEGNVKTFHSTRYHPLAVGRPLRILFLGDDRPLSLPTDLLPDLKSGD
jgi:hypothetical protein